MTGSILIRSRDKIVAECKSVEEAAEIARKENLGDVLFEYSYEVAYMDQGRLMVDHTSAKEIKKDLETIIPKKEGETK